MARAMVADKEMLIVFWAEVVNVSVYLQNRSYTSVVENKTPFEVFTGRNQMLNI